MTEYTPTQMDVENLPYRKLLCDVIKQAIDWTHGKNLHACLEQSSLRNRPAQKQKVMKQAREYLKSTDFEDDCNLLGIDYRPIREKLFGKARKQYKPNRKIRKIIWYGK